FRDKTAQDSLEEVIDTSWIQQASVNIHENDEILICDSFLLGCCKLGFACPKHHSSYPYHWQLQRKDTNQWISVPDAAQVQLEKLYCNSEKDQAILKAYNSTWTLDFDSMTVQLSNVFHKARRLSNTACSGENPHFPTVWKLYWQEYSHWIEYSEMVASSLEDQIRCMKEILAFSLNGKSYEVDFKKLVQKNTNTGFIRRIRRRPIFRSEQSMRPQLNTLFSLFFSFLFNRTTTSNYILLPDGLLPDFKTWYPPQWKPTVAEDKVLKISVSQSETAYLQIHKLFHKTLPETKAEIVEIFEIINVFLWDKYKRQERHMSHKHEKDKLSIEEHLFHGTKEAVVDSICKMNFDPRVSGRIAFGAGCYFARDASYSHNYASETNEGFRYMFLAKVLLGQKAVGRPEYRHPPPLRPGSSNSDLYDCCVDNLMDPTIFVVFDSCQCYPYYLIKYRTPTDVVDIVS
uniref:Poly [ADP-ribose] polymerase n=1 Tax=Latimeria chalumnae TaxID=7897 RepID=H3BGQ5_LATCH